MFKIEFNSYSKEDVVLTIVKKEKKYVIDFKFKFKSKDNNVIFEDSYMHDGEHFDKEKIKIIILEAIDKYQEIDIDDFDQWWASDVGFKLIGDVNYYVNALYNNEVR